MRFVLVRRNETEKHPIIPYLAAVGGALVGASSISLLQRKRRRQLQQRTGHLIRELSSAKEVLSEDLRNRTLGLLHESAGRLRPQTVSDEVLINRVRSRLGRVCSNPSAIVVDAHNGEIAVSGPILEAEKARMVASISKVRGVHRIINMLEVHETADVPALRGKRGTRFRIASNWSPTARLFAGLAGTGVVTLATRRKGLLRIAAGIAGVSLLLRAITNLEAKRLSGVKAGPRAIDLQKSIWIASPRNEVFNFLSSLEKLPQFMSHIREVKNIGPGLWHWTIIGPANLPIEWNAQICRFEPDEVIEWQSARDSIFESAGEVRFKDESSGTRIMIKMSYNPPGGAIGHALAKLIGSDPRKMMNDDLLRLKSLLEKGSTRGDKKIMKEDIAPKEF